MSSKTASPVTEAVICPSAVPASARAQGGRPQDRSVPAGVRTVFVIGPPRSGTTLLSFLLAGGPNVLSLSEPFRLHRVFPRFGIRWLLRELRRKHDLQGTPPAWHANDRVLLEHLRGAARSNGMSTLIIKETFRSELAWANLGLLQQFVDGGDPVIGIIRHPYDCAVSTLRMFRLWRGVVGELVQFLVPDLPLFRGDEDIAENVARTWNDFATWCETRELLLVKYEDLARDPRATLAGVCTKAGLAFDPCMLDHRHPRGPFGGIGDPGVMTRPARPVSTKSIGRRRRLPIALQEILSSVCAPSAARFGYAL